MSCKDVCHFIPEYKDNVSVQIINFVLETEKQLAENKKTSSVYMMNYVLEGEGCMILDGQEEILRADMCHYCPKGHSHTFINKSDKDLIFFAVVPEQ